MGKSRSHYCSEKKDSKKDESGVTKKKVEHSSGIKPFLYITEDWHKDAPTQLLKTTEGRKKTDNKMIILQGNKTPKTVNDLFKELQYKNLQQRVFDASGKAGFSIKGIINKEAQTIVSNVEANFEGYYGVEDIDEIHHHCIWIEIGAEFNSDDKIIAYFAATGTAPCKKR